MDTVKLYHYVYRITNKVTNMHYYGKRSSQNKPVKDLGVLYFSSSKDKNFIKDQKENSNDYKYKIIKIFNCPIKALNLEIKLHNIFNVGINPNFYNIVKQTSNKFDSTGSKLTEKHKEKISKSMLGKVHTEESKLNMSKAQKGRIITDEHKEKIRKSNTANPKGNLRFANIYNYENNELIASNVILESWAKNNNYNAGHLRATALTRLYGSSGKTKRFKHKNVYAIYIDTTL